MSYILAGEISRLEAHVTKLDNKIFELKDANKLLADDLRESSATTNFSRSEAVVGRNATAIRSKIADIEKERDDANAAIGRLTLTI